MLFGDKEIDLIDHLQHFWSSGISQTALIPNPTPELESIVHKVCDKENWDKWIVSSGKSDPPPDFYSDEYRLMMDVMRVNDHEQKGKKGKLYNPSMAHEKEMLRELEQAGILKQFPNAKVFLNGDTKLPTHEDHNYTLYLKNFSRVIRNHIDSIPLYKSNHPGYATVFFVFDESSAYFEADHPIDFKKQVHQGDMLSGRPHLFFADENFLDVFVNQGIDYLFWYTPYKMFEMISPPLTLPTLCGFDLSNKDFSRIKYDKTKMSSVEV